MLNPINIAFKKAKLENRPALLTYTVAGDNSKKNSLKILKSISKYADILEIGIPHNTPVADGSQIQTSAYRAIKNGIKIKDIFEIVKNLKKNNISKPIVGFIAGRNAPPGRRMGHAGAIVSGGDDTAEAKMRILKECGIEVANSVADIGQLMKDLMK